MSLHDEYARITPFELLFAQQAQAAALSESIAEEAAGRGTDDGSPDVFLTMGVVTDFVRTVGGGDAPPDAVHRYGALAFHAVHFTRAGSPLYLLETAVARLLIDGATRGRPEPPAPSGYLQLPRHLFWVVDGSVAPESVDGVCWTISDGERLHAMLVSGVRADHTGLRVVPLPEAPVGEAATWLDFDARGDGADFSNPMPGAEMDALLALSTSGEVLKLLARFFAFVQEAPAALIPAVALRTERSTTTQGVAEGSADAGPVPSTLDYVRVTDHGRAGD
jgi:hypothetical protein